MQARKSATPHLDPVMTLSEMKYLSPAVFPRRCEPNRSLYCVMNIKERDAFLARAGHPAPLHVCRTTGEVQPVTSSKASDGPAIGIIPNAQFKTIEARLAPNDFLLFFTDGVIEVEDKECTEFGIEGLQQSVRSHLDQPTESLLDAIISDVYKFAGSTVLTDDACLVAADLQTSASTI